MITCTHVRYLWVCETKHYVIFRAVGITEGLTSAQVLISIEEMRSMGYHLRSMNRTDLVIFEKVNTHHG